MKTVMVVDDSMISRQMIINELEVLGYEVIAEASNGKEAISKYLQFNPDIVTMDITMPGYNGLTALKDILFQDKNAKIIMITAHGEESLVMDAITFGAIGYVLKPITKEKLQNQLQKAEQDV
jgi:two-component system chemotaxis response regulator CheY